MAGLACSWFGLPTGSSDAETPPPSTSDAQAANNPCANLFLPFEPGNSWIYEVKRDSGEEARIDLAVSGVEGSRATLDLPDMSTSTTIQTIAECDNGAIMNYTALSLGRLVSHILQGVIQIEYVAGVFMPAESDFLTNNGDLAWYIRFGE